eukprot:CAMPEP_0196761220 /NCGR_PEP_ID=MMETSP1095-20130614/389_1 /TAXON_ID=96789 ORGANISM="Chromulina nebulosa, Strain UTEXLB2642" /NCGR_SAMPLE_ID=MMETSP1095 /ASSEMBLY_ACC=CAM_ASM_000446 /LENGTH=729 /DNA_ID=CAMNT_0042110473 /DNA_START=146 /DNA_END=2338 /DNA_ORIENTATION=+
MFDKIWESHLVDESDSNALIYIDRHLVHEVTSPQAFEGLRIAGRSVRRPDCTLVTVDHNIPTTDRSNYKDSSSFILESDSRIQVVTLEENIKELGLTYFGLDDKRQGIVHIIGPEQGFTLPGSTIVCGDSHTATHGAFGALAFGIGTSEVEHVLATQTLIQSKAKNMRISVDGDLPTGVTSKDIILHIIGAIGTAGGTGHVIEFAGSAIKSLSMEARMSICNMAIEAGARAGMIAPDEITFEYLKGRPMAPKGELWNQAVKYWNTLSSDPDAKYDKDIIIPASSIAPTVTWGTSPQDALPITGVVPDPKDYSSNPDRAATIQRSLDYMGLIPGTPLNTIKIDKVFIGSCTNARIEDIRAAASIAKGRKVASHVYAMVVPGSGLVKAQAEFEGLDVILKEAGFDWREPGCSMCLAMNPDKLEPGERCASTSNRNFEGRQGTGGRTHLVSPAMAAAAAVSGHLTDVREVDAAIINLPSETSAFTDLLEAINRPAENSITPTKTSIASTSEDIVISDPTKQFTEITGIAAKLAIQNIDTDMIIPKQFLKTIKRSGLGGALFYNLRYENNIEKPDFILNQGKFRQSSILVAGENFGCGSSREHAPWALYDFGIRAIISTSYADIFYNNCFKNGILPINLSKNEVELLMKDADEGLKLNINLHTNSITRESGDVISFSIDSFRRDCLLNGLDDIGLTMKKLTKIQEFERKRSIHEPWYDNASQIFITSSSKVNN